MVISPKKQVPSTVTFRNNSEQTTQHLFRFQDAWLQVYPKNIALDIIVLHIIMLNGQLNWL
jgi:hypothetical protein